MKQYPVVVCMLLLLITACKPTNDQISEGGTPTTFSKINSQYQYYVSAYTSGMISATSPIRVRFANDIVSSEEVGGEAPSDIVKFEPTIAGGFIWEDRKTLLFQPDSWLPAGQLYTAVANLKAVYPNIQRTLQQMPFDFKVIKQNFEVVVRGLREASLTDLNTMRLIGTVFTEDAAIARSVEQMLSMEQAGNTNLSVTWEHATSNKTHRFVIEGIKTFEKGSELMLNWDGKSLGIDKTIEQEKIAIPSSEFTLLDAKVVQEANDQDPYVLLSFSLPLQQIQSLKGLVSIENYENVDYSGRSNYRHVIDGNELRVYPLNTVEGVRKVHIAAGIKSINNAVITDASEWEVSFNAQKPGVRLVGNGVIIPKTKGLYFPFEATKLRGVKVELFKIYEKNVLRFLQTENMNSNYGLHYVGRVVAQKYVQLDQVNEASNKNRWVRYGLNLDDLVKDEEGAIYQVRLAFDKKDALCDCIDPVESEMQVVDHTPKRNDAGELISIFDGNNYYYYDYENRDNPCHPAYYNERQFAKRNMLGSNLGIITKQGKDKELFIAVTDLLSAEPIPNATVEVYDNVLQRMVKMSTNSDGIVQTKTQYTPSFVVVSHQKQKGYLHLRYGRSLSLSTFDTDGTEDKEGLKGMLYGERGVWRPGDSLYLSFVLEDKQGTFPDDHPVTFELYDPRGNLYQSMTTNQHVHSVYDFRTKTPMDAETGSWSAKVHVGGSTFYKNVRIETVKPNRLKIALDLGKDRLLSSDRNLSGDLSIKWLHGAPAMNIDAQIDVLLRPEPTKFEGYDAVVFDDPARESYYSSPMTVFDGTVNEDGKAKIGGVLELAKQPSGFMRAGFTTRAYEKGGDVSSDNFSMTFSPYASYVGLKSPKGEMDKSLDLNVENAMEAIVLDENGRPVANQKVTFGMYKISWNWWWDRENEINNFNTTQHLGALETKTLTTDQSGKVTWKMVPKEWGRYMVRVVNDGSGHSCGMIFHAGSPWNDANFNDKEAATMLAFGANKEAYNVGEEVVLEIPAGEAGRALLTLENGFKVIEHQWVPIATKDGVQRITFKTKENMAPTIYAHITLLQPHQQVKNDLPLRSYGVIPIKVINPKTKLKPALDMADVLAPNESVKIKVSEENNQAMTYTLAIVDEGLLDLTRFKTPDLWEHFYQKEALGVKTWDMYNMVLAAQQYDQLLAIGGGAGLNDDGKKANRFKPVVRFAGPFHLKAGATAEHNLQMPNYVGSVRTMLIASEAGAYGKAEKTTPVRKPLMVLGTLPRVLSPTEQVKLPVTIFAMEEGIKNVTVRVECNDLLKVQGASEQQISFDKIGEGMMNFNLTVAEKLGIAKVKIIAESGKEKSTYEVELDVRNPNPYSNKLEQLVLDPGKDWNMQVEPLGMIGTNEAYLELSMIPPIDLGKRLDYLIRYPYGCIEQTTSAVFPQLYVGNLMKVEPEMETSIEENVRKAIKRIQKFQTGMGGFAYWQGGGEASEWGTSYAGHFLLEAKAKGYAVPKTMLNDWKRYQKVLAKNWRFRTMPVGAKSDGQDALMQAYRLYTLALAGSPDLGAMNKMRSIGTFRDNAMWRLAAAYAIIGKKEVAKSIIKGLSMEVPEYTELSYTYGSALRDQAMILETLALLGERTKGANMILKMSKKLSSRNWYATQTVAYSLMAIAKFVGVDKLPESIPFAYKIGEKALQQGALKDQPIVQHTVDIDNMKDRKILVENKGKAPLFASVVMTGQPPLNDTEADASNISLEVVYEDLNGNKIDPTNIEQGTNFMAKVSIKHGGMRGRYDEMALDQVFPAGWEIVNTRMNEAFDNIDSSPMDYQNVRDDRVYTYFDLPMSRTYTYKFYLTAAYQGKFYMPNVACAAMYDNSIYANTAGKWVTVSAPKGAL